jgi:hypothetical protein
MTTIGDHVAWLLPQGSSPESEGSIASCPDWPPDLFVVAATLVERSECYVRPPFATPAETGYLFDEAYRGSIRELAAAWGTGDRAPPDVQALWSRLLDARDQQVERDEDADWHRAALMLMAAADEASAGIGFYVQGGFAGKFVEDYGRMARRERTALALPRSICLMVPADRACVQPKTNTPQRGCTLRSLTHHLALLPGYGTVRTEWWLPTRAPQPGEEGLNTRPLALLLVPFPYFISNQCFKAGPTFGLRPDGARARRSSDQQRFGYFEVEQRWLLPPDGDAETGANDIAEFIASLVKSARNEVDAIDGVILPEAVLNKRVAGRIAQRLNTLGGLRWFVAGVQDHAREGDPVASNWAQFCRFEDGAVTGLRHQKKHHRWLLDRSQIETYGLTRQLDSRIAWWEHIDLRPRSCNFYVLRGGGCMTAIVCEDLARHDPVMPVLRAVGPNLVVCLLMDGPQKRDRWPARHATVLADDPGCSVLTLSSLGMLRRSGTATYGESREIALWRQPDGRTVELKLPPGDHALLLELEVRPTRQASIDGRLDAGLTPHFCFIDARGIRAQNASSWLGLDT